MIRWIALIVLINFGNYCKAKQWHTTANGFWDDSSTWKNSIPPSNHISDSVYIHHNIKFRQNIYFNNGYFLVESNGGLCGNYNIQFGAGATIDQYGNIFCDSILIAGATMKTYGPGALLVHSAMSVKGPAPALYSKLSGGYLHVGADYTCNSESGFKELLSTTNSLIENIQFSPIPFDENLSIHLPISGFNYQLKFYSLEGACLYETEGNLENGTILINTSELPLHTSLLFYRFVIPNVGENSGLLMRDSK